MVEQEAVGKAWAAGKAASANNFSTNGKDIFSYALIVGKTVGGKKIAIDYTKTGGYFKSATTSKHVFYVKKYADKVVSPPKMKAGDRTW